MLTGVFNLLNRFQNRVRPVFLSFSAMALALGATTGAVSPVLAAGGVQPSGLPVVAVPGYQISVFARGTADYAHPDSILSDGHHLFIDYQNVTAKDGSDNKSSTVVEYNTNGTVVRTFSIGGHSDGLRMNPVDHLLWATSNEDGNAVFHTINPTTGEVVAYQFAGAPHGGGYDDLIYLYGQMYIVASNPTLDANGVNVFPALDRMTLSGSTVTLTPVLMGNASATDPTTNSAVTLNEVDPDSLSIDSSGNLVLVNQGGTEVVTIQNPCTSQQAVTRLAVGSQLDDTVWATSAGGQLFVVDGSKNVTYTLRTSFTPGTVFTETPSDSGVSGVVGTLSLKTGIVSPIAVGFGSPTGMMFLSDTPTPAPSTIGPACGPAAAVTSELQKSNSGTLTGSTGGGFATYQATNPTGAALNLTLSYNPFDTTTAHSIGMNVYQNGNQLASVSAKGKGSGDSVDNSSPSVTVIPSATGGPVLIQIYSYDSRQIAFTLTQS